MSGRITAWDLGKHFSHVDADHLAPPPATTIDDDPDSAAAADAITEAITDDGDEDPIDDDDDNDDPDDDVDGLSVKKNTYAHAQRIALDLFTNGQGEQADHLVLMQSTRELGGWGLVPFTDRLCDLLDEKPLPASKSQVRKGKSDRVK